MSDFADSLKVPVGGDVLLRFYVTTGPKIVVTQKALAGATTVQVGGLKESLTSGTRIRWGDGVGEHVAVLSAPAVVGATQLLVDALPGELSLGEIGYKVQDVSGWTAVLVVRRNHSDEGDPLVQRLLGVSSGVNGVLEVLWQRSDTFESTFDTMVMEPGTYAFGAWRSDPGSYAPLARGDFIVDAVATPS